MNGIEFALQVLVIGFLVVMTTLVLLYFLLQLFGIIFHREDGRPHPGKTSTAKGIVAGPADDKKIKAAIMGAIYQYMEAGGSPGSGANLSFTVTPDEFMPGNSWKLQGRKNLLNRRVELETIRRKKQRENF